MKSKKQYTSEYKAKIAIETLREEKTPSEIASREEINVKQVYNWRQTLLENARLVFDQSKTEREFERSLADAAKREDELMSKVGRLTVENDWLKKNVRKSDASERRSLILPGDPEFSVRRQCELLGINRSGLYYAPTPVMPMDTELKEYIMTRIDFWNTTMCYIGARKIHNKLLIDDSVDVSLETVRAFMGQMGIHAVYPHPKTSKGDKNAAKPPYLLHNMNIWLPNMVWSIDITYIKMNRGHMYLTAIIDWFSRLLLNWELSDTLETAPVLECVDGAFRKHGLPIIVNSDQGSQFTSKDYMQLLRERRVRQSMDGKGRWVENRRIERWFRSLKVENIYITEYQTPRQLRVGIGGYIDQYNAQRPHESLSYERPAVFHNSFFKL